MKVKFWNSPVYDFESEGILFSYNFNEGDGDELADLSGNGNNASFSFGAVPSHTTGTSGFFTFAGADNERAILSSFDTDIISSGSRVDAAAIECWVQGNSVDNAMLWDAGNGSTRDRWGMRYSWIGNDKFVYFNQ